MTKPADPSPSDSPPPSSRPPPSSSPGRGRPCVLLADDSPVARLTIARRLRAEGFRVLEGATADEALASAAMTLPECALLDLDLGDADGSEVAARLRVTYVNLPIAFFSDAESEDSVERARTMGPVFAKPHELDAAVTWVKLHAR